jgi:hypothetical protein
MLKNSVLAGGFVLARCEMFAYPSTVTHKSLKLSYFSKLV